MKYYFKIAILGHHLRLLTYYSKVAVPVGARVWVHVRTNKKLGIVVEQVTDTANIKNIKPLTLIDRVECLDRSMLDLAKWMSNYYYTPLAEVLALMLPSEGFASAELNNLNANRILQVSAAGMSAKASSAQSKFLAWLKSRKDFLNTFASCQDAGFSAATINACDRRGWITSKTSQPKISKVELRPEQQSAVDTILNTQGFLVSVLDGVTGSGKTEVYCEVITKIIATGKQALVLVPEIGLTQQTVARFVARCGVPAIVMHSKISAQQKLARWQAAHAGKGQLVIGTRSSLFAPLQQLGIIIIDESHDPSFKQQNTCLYSAKHAAIMLAKFKNIPVVMGTATPTLESLYRCQQGAFKYIELKQKAFGFATAKTNILNLCGQQHENGIAMFVKTAISETISEQQQTLVFVNRRGYAPTLLCHACGTAQQCQSCDSNFVLHQQPYELRCHHCAKVAKVPERCTECGAKSWISPGFGTQKVAEQIQAWFPESNVIRIDRDNTKSNSQFDQALSVINSGSAEIIIGTQMLAKGHDFHNIGLVVILDCDSQLYNPDYMAIERLAQQLIQVAGRAGRRSDASKILVQTHNPKHPVFQVLNVGYQEWAQQELFTRKQYGLSPFVYTINIHVQAQKRASLDRIRTEFSTIKFEGQANIVGPIANIRPKRKGFWRDVIILTANNRAELHKQASLIRAYACQLGWDKLAQWRYDVDPIEQS